MSADAITEEFITQVESEKVSISYYPISVCAFVCFPQILYEGVEIDGSRV